ncbi:MAG TPA: hypothetical protein VN748_22495 [Pseudonocardiaceae bacterium]|jgi:hypothetical protein|nr:hypothetical protein [Pseudonocardiaceae bacterium]
MSNAANHAAGRTRAAQPQNRYVDLAPQNLHWSDTGRTKPVRRSVDLSPTYHAQLTQWCVEAAEIIGTPRVTGQDVIRALVARLLMDESLARRIRDDLSMDI